MYQFRSKNLILQTTQLKRGAIYILKIEAWSVCNLLNVAIDIKLHSQDPVHNGQHFGQLGALSCILLLYQTTHADSAS